MVNRQSNYIMPKKSRLDTMKVNALKDVQEPGEHEKTSEVGTSISTV